MSQRLDMGYRVLRSHRLRTFFQPDTDHCFLVQTFLRQLCLLSGIVFGSHLRFGQLTVRVMIPSPQVFEHWREQDIITSLRLSRTKKTCHEHAHVLIPNYRNVRSIPAIKNLLVTNYIILQYQHSVLDHYLNTYEITYVKPIQIQALTDYLL